MIAVVPHASPMASEGVEITDITAADEEISGDGNELMVKLSDGKTVIFSPTGAANGHGGELVMQEVVGHEGNRRRIGLEKPHQLQFVKLLMGSTDVRINQILDSSPWYRHTRPVAYAVSPNEKTDLLVTGTVRESLHRLLEDLSKSD